VKCTIKYFSLSEQDETFNNHVFLFLGQSNIANDKMKLMLLKVNDKVVHYKDIVKKSWYKRKFNASCDLVFVNAVVSSLGEIHYSLLSIKYKFILHHYYAILLVSGILLTNILIQMLQSDWLSHHTVSTISVQWLGIIYKVAMFWPKFWRKRR